MRRLAGWRGVGMVSFTLRDCEAADIPVIGAICGHWVTHGLASFEREPPAAEEMLKRRAAMLAAGYPCIVAEGRAGAARRRGRGS